MSAPTIDTPMPSLKDIREIISDLLGRDIDVSPTSPESPGKDFPASIAVYTDEHLAMHALTVVEYSLSVFFGAALGLVPPGGAKATVEDKEFPTTLRDNFYEVMNIFSALFNVPDAPHLKIYELYAHEDTVPGDVLGHAVSWGRRTDLLLSVAGYGSGKFSIVLTN